MGDTRTSSDMMTKQVKRANLPPRTVKFVPIYVVGCAYSNISSMENNQSSAVVILSFPNDSINMLTWLLLLWFKLTNQPQWLQIYIIH